MPFREQKIKLSMFNLTMSREKKNNVELINKIQQLRLYLFIIIERKENIR